MSSVVIRDQSYLLITAGDLLDTDRGKCLFTTTPDGSAAEGMLVALERRGNLVVLHLDTKTVEVLAAKQIALGDRLAE